MAKARSDEQNPLLQVRVTKDVHAKLAAKAAADNRPLASYVRVLILRDLGLAK